MGNKKVAAFIPIKTHSSRVPGKNFKILNGKPLYQHIIDHAIEADCFDRIYVDSDSDEILDYADTNYCGLIARDPELVKDSANGNDLLNYHYSKFMNYEYYFQLFATAPFLEPETIKECVKLFCDQSYHDSILTITKEHGWFWKAFEPLYRPSILPRSQDFNPLFKETTGLYGITNESLKTYKCRIGKKPLFWTVSRIEAVDLDTEEDFKLAEALCALQ